MGDFHKEIFSDIMSECDWNKCFFKIDKKMDLQKMKGFYSLVKLSSLKICSIYQLVFMSFEGTKAAPEWPTKDGGSVGTYPTKAGPWDDYPTEAGPWDDYPTKAGPWDDYPTK